MITGIYALFLLIVGLYLLFKGGARMTIAGFMIFITGITLLMTSVTDVAGQTPEAVVLIILFLIVWSLFLINYLRLSSSKQKPIEPGQTK